MNIVKFFIYQVLLTFIGITNNLFFSFLNELTLFEYKFVLSLVKVPITMLILYFIFRLYYLLNMKLRYKILIHISAFIVGFVILGLLSGSIKA